jgi:Zn2+/Cd2+-exporting ATPase
MITLIGRKPGLFVKTEIFKISGMRCAGCAANVEKALRAVAGVAEVSVNAATGKALCRFDSRQATAEALAAAVRDAGYAVEKPAAAAPAQPWWRAPWLPVAAVVVLIVAGSALHLEAVLIAATMLAVYPILWNALKSLARRQLNAEVLVATGVIASASIGQFLAAAEVALIMRLGELLENYTIERARRSIGGLMEHMPLVARVRRGSMEEEVAVEQVRVGDLCVVRPGEKIPVDGVVESGQSSVNQAAVTGESAPADKAGGDEVFSGTLNVSGALIVRAARVAAESTLARIAALVEAAQQREAPIQRTLDRWAGWMVPLMITLSLLTLAFTHDVTRAITVLIVACPCALVLATPTAIVAAIARAAREGVLIKGGQYLEAAGRLKAVVFDKTGTLTRGEPSVTDVKQFCPEHSAAEMIALAAVAEKMSQHPVGRAVVERAGEMRLPVPDPAAFEAHHGEGVSARHNGQRILVGKRSLLERHDVALDAGQGAHLDEHEAHGHTTLMVAHDGKVCGTICVSDEPRAQAGDAVAELRRLGIEKVVMLTGDNPRVARSLATRLGIADVEANVMPEGKAARIESLREAHGAVAMVGDGVNDAPALATADVGVAMGVSGTDAAHDAADIALIADDLGKVAFAVGLSRHTLRIIRQGLVFALLFNVTMISSAMHGVVSLIGGAIAHQISSLVVIVNAMRLLGYGKPGRRP